MAKEKFECVTPEGRTSFMNVFTRKTWEDNDEGDYQVTVLFDKQEDLMGVKEIVDQALADEFGSNVPSTLEMPWKKGEDCLDKEGNVRDGYEGKVVIRAKSKYQPIILGPDAQQLTDLDKDTFESGDYGRIKVQAKVWEYAGKRGISLYLKVIQKTKTGEKFGGKVDLSEFGPVSDTSMPAEDLF